MEIGQKLKDKRASLGLSQEDLAEKIGVTRQTIANWEKGKTYPDIGSVLKLSDLYNVSLDELLKEDAAMRKHTEEAAALPRRYWNILFEVAILLLPFGLLVAYWGLNWVGLGLQIIGLLMMPPLWFARHRMFGMSQEDLKNSLIGWAMFVGAAILRAFSGDDLVMPLVASILSMIGILMIYSHGVYLERGTRFWLVIFLYIGIPVYIFGSLFMEQFAEQGAFSKAQPFGAEYRISAVEIGEASDPNVILAMDQSLAGGNLKIGDHRIGRFEYVEPAKHQQETVKGIWHLAPEDDPDGLYKLEVSADDNITLSYLIDDQLQWRWQLQKIPKVWFVLNNTEFNVAYQMAWFTEGTFSGELETTNDTTLSEETTAYLQCKFEGITELTLIEEYHHNGKTETREYTLVKDKNDNFPLSEAPVKRYTDSEQYILYRLQWYGGEYLFRLNFE